MVVTIKKILLTLILITYLFEGAMAEELTTSDRLDIIDVMSSYAKGIDTKDFDFYEKIFSEDVEVNIIGLSSLLKDLISGTYTVTVTDANGETTTASVAVTTPEELILLINMAQVIIFSNSAFLVYTKKVILSICWCRLKMLPKMLS